MEAFLVKRLFSVLGFTVTPKTILKVLLGLAVVVLLWLAYSKAHDHFQHIKDLESNNQKLTEDKNKLQGQLTQLKRINQDNASVNKTTGDQREAATNIANNEQAASSNRATRTREISNEIDHTKPTTTPVDPVITHTLDKLWN